MTELINPREISWYNAMCAANDAETCPEWHEDIFICCGCADKMGYKLQETTMWEDECSVCDQECGGTSERNWKKGF